MLPLENKPGDALNKNWVESKMPPGCITCTQATQGDAVRPADHPHSITPALLAPPPGFAPASAFAHLSQNRAHRRGARTSPFLQTSMKQLTLREAWPLHGYGMQVPYMPLGWLSGVPLDLVFYLLPSSWPPLKSFIHIHPTPLTGALWMKVLERNHILYQFSICNNLQWHKATCDRATWLCKTSPVCQTCLFCSQLSQIPSKHRGCAPFSVWRWGELGGTLTQNFL